MKLYFKNTSSTRIRIHIDSLDVILPGDQTSVYACIATSSPFEIKFSIIDCENNENNHLSCFFDISTVILCDFDDLQEARIIIGKKAKRFQNYTRYRYLTIDSPDLNILDIKHTVDNYDSTKAAGLVLGNNIKSRLLHILKKSIVDAIIDGALVSIIIMWVFSFWVALGVFSSVFIIAFIINSIKIWTSRSKCRVLNIDKDDEMPDDIVFFVKNIENYCS